MSECVYGSIKGKKVKKKKREENRRKIKKTYVLEVIKRDSEEPAVDLIYTGQ